MGKRLGILVAVVLGAVLAIGVAASALADDPTPPCNGWGSMWEWCHGGAGGPSGGGASSGPYLDPTSASQVAKLLGITPQELLNQRGGGQSVFQIAQAKGYSEQQVLDGGRAEDRRRSDALHGNRWPPR